MRLTYTLDAEHEHSRHCKQGYEVDERVVSILSMYQTHTHTSTYIITVSTEICACEIVYLTHRTEGERLVDMVDCNGWTPLHYACFDSNKELIEHLMEAGADIWARYFFDTSSSFLHTQS